MTSGTAARAAVGGRQIRDVSMVEPRPKKKYSRAAVRVACSSGCGCSLRPTMGPIDNRAAALGGAGHPSQTASSEMESRLANKARQDGAEKASEARGAEIGYH